MPQVDLDPDGPVPLYRQLADVLRLMIDSGEIPPGRAIPSKRAAGQIWGIGGHSFDRAVWILRDEGRIESVKGKGWFVTRLPARPLRRHESAYPRTGQHAAALPGRCLHWSG